MAVKRVKQSNKQDFSSSPLLILDRFYFHSNDKQIYRDPGFYFDDAPESLTRDEERLRSYAINGIVYAREEGENNWVYLLTNYNLGDGKDRVFEVVVASEDATEDFLSVIKETYGEEIKITLVPENQLLLDFPEVDESMVQFNEEKENKKEAVHRLIVDVLRLDSNTEHPIKPIHILEQVYNSISWHIGMDGDKYFNLGNDKREKTVGMNEERLVEFLQNISPSDIKNLVLEGKENSVVNNESCNKHTGRHM